MNLPSDCLLVGPTTAEVHAALVAAVRRRDFTWPLATLEGFFSEWLEGFEQDVEGLELFRLSSGRDAERYCGMAWWTDAVGRRHARILEGNTADGEVHRHLARQDVDPRPPLWHVYPEQVFHVCRPGQPGEWRVACPCGMVGSPADLAWMGLSCGPCHDRREEGESQSGPPLSGAIDFRSPVCGVDLSADRETLAVAMRRRELVLYHLPRRSVRPLLTRSSPSRENEEIHLLSFAPDGSVLAAADRRHQTIHVWSLVEGSPRHDSFAEEPIVDPTHLVFSPDGRHLAACGRTGGACIWHLSEGKWQAIHLPGEVQSLAFQPDGRALYLGCERSEVRVVDTESWEERDRFILDPGGEGLMFLAFVVEGTRLVAMAEPAFYPVGDDVCPLHLWDLESRKLLRKTIQPVPSLAALSPDGRTLARAYYDDQHSPAAVSLWDVERWQEVGEIEWDPDDTLRALSFCSDGEILVTGSYMGRVVLLPWRGLLEV